MKKLLSLIVAAVMLTVSFNAVLGANDITVRLDGEKIEFDVQPQIINDRTMVPMRAIFEALGTEVMWDETTKSVTAEKEDTVIIMTIGEELMFVNYSPVTLDAPPQIVDDRTLVPVRAIAESFECKVDWDETSRVVTITTGNILPEATSSPDVTAAPDGTAEAKETASPEKTAVPKATATPKATTAPEASADPSETASPQETAAPEEMTVPEETVSAANEQNLSEEANDTEDEDISDDEDEDEEDVQSEDITIRYEAGYELSSHSAGGFRITSMRTTSDGKYEIEYYLQTFQDGSGKQVVIFDCLDENDKVIDSFGGYFFNDAYTWADQTGTAVISGRTAKIRLSEENQK